MSLYVKTDTVLDKILAHKVDEITAAQARLPLDAVKGQLRDTAPPRDFLAALQRDTVALIAEVKKASPSKGVLMEDFDPVALAMIYATNGAAAISVLTDERFFQGHLDYLRAVRAVVNVPVLRKEFVIDPYQIYEGRAVGADAVLLITAALDDAHLADLHALVLELGMTPLVEVHNEAELERALQIAPRLIGVNNRDLKTFHEDLGTTARLARLVPPEVTLVAESAIRRVEDVRLMGQYGAGAILVGESLVKAGNIPQRVREFSTQRRKGES
ncbi:MAG: indole-3-glycerol phosphate synthase TrpC [Anaerolineaceae bacterium]|nr:indole-3-glycerol phosphate synthase TrpC [Anaerolineaceae bacterium]